MVNLCVVIFCCDARLEGDCRVDEIESRFSYLESAQNLVVCNSRGHHALKVGARPGNADVYLIENKIQLIKIFLYFHKVIRQRSHVYCEGLQTCTN